MEAHDCGPQCHHVCHRCRAVIRRVRWIAFVDDFCNTACTSSYFANVVAEVISSLLPSSQRWVQTKEQASSFDTAVVLPTCSESAPISEEMATKRVAEEVAAAVATGGAQAQWVTQKGIQYLQMAITSTVDVILAITFNIQGHVRGVQLLRLPHLPGSISFSFSLSPCMYIYGVPDADDMRYRSALYNDLLLLHSPAAPLRLPRVVDCWHSVAKRVGV